MADNLKEYMGEKYNPDKKDREIFEEMDLDVAELKAVRFVALDEELSISGLVAMVLKDKKDKEIPEDCVDDLVLREYIDEDGELTEKGKSFLEEGATKERLKKLVS